MHIKYIIVGIIIYARDKSFFVINPVSANKYDSYRNFEYMGSLCCMMLIDQRFAQSVLYMYASI